MVHLSWHLKTSIEIAVQYVHACVLMRQTARSYIYILNMLLVIHLDSSGERWTVNAINQSLTICLWGKQWDRRRWKYVYESDDWTHSDFMANFNNGSLSMTGTLILHLVYWAPACPSSLTPSALCHRQSFVEPEPSLIKLQFSVVSLNAWAKANWNLLSFQKASTLNLT